MKVTWNARKGDPASHVSYGITFEAGKPVDVTDEAVLKKFAGNPFFTVAEGKPGKTVEIEDGDEEEAAAPARRHRRTRAEIDADEAAKKAA